jgi:hypothetical protein
MRGVVVGGAVPGGLLFWEWALALSGVVILTVTRLATSGIAVTLALAFSAAVSDASGIAVLSALQSCSETRPICTPIEDVAASSQSFADP